MSFSLTSFVRLVALSASVLTLTAVGLSRAVPKPSVPRAGVTPRYFGVNGTSFATPASHNYLLDAETGDLIRLPVYDGISLDYAACAPWRDEQGGYEIIGRAAALTGSESHCLPRGMGLGRALVKNFRVGEMRFIDLVVTSRPCWLNGKPSRVLFAAGDGELYTVDLVEGGGDEVPCTPRRLVWDCPRPGTGLVVLGDPICPPVAALGGRLLVSLSARGGRSGGVPLDRPEVWWLEVHGERNAVRAAGRMTAPSAADRDERLPNLGVTVDGRLSLAYLARREGEPSWHLMLAAVVIDPESGPVLATEPRDLGDGFSVNVPAFSPDGRTVLAVPRHQAAVPTARRFSVDAALGRADLLRGHAAVNGGVTPSD